MMNALALDPQRVTGVMFPAIQKEFPFPESEEGLSFPQKFKNRIGLLDRSRLPDLPELLFNSRERYRTILQKELTLNLKHTSRKIKLENLLPFFHPYKVSLVGKMAKVVLGNEWFSQAAKNWVQLDDALDLGLSDKTDIDFRIEVGNEDPCYVAENFLKGITKRFFSHYGDVVTVCDQLRSRGGPFKYFDPIVEGNTQGQFKTNAFLISYKSDELEFDFYIVNKVDNSAAATHENLIIEVDRNALLRVKGDRDDGKEAVIDYLSKDLKIVSDSPRAWVRTVCDRLAGFLLADPLPEALFQSFSLKRLDDLEKLFRHRFEPSEDALFQLGVIALKDLCSHQVDNQFIGALFEKIKEMGCRHFIWKFLAYHFHATRQVGEAPRGEEYPEWMVNLVKMQQGALLNLRRFFFEHVEDRELEVPCLEMLMPHLFLQGTPEQFKKEVIELSDWLLVLISRRPECEELLKNAFGALLERVLAAKRVVLCKGLFETEFSQRYSWAFSELKSRFSILYMWQKGDITGILPFLSEVQDFYVDEEGLALDLIERLLHSDNPKEVKQGLRLYDRIHNPIPHHLQSQLSLLSGLRDNAEVELQAKKQRLPDMLQTLEANDSPNKYIRLFEVLQVISDLPNESPGMQAHMARIVNILHGMRFSDEELPAILELLLPLVDPFLKDCTALVLGMITRSPPQSKEELHRLKPLLEAPNFPWITLFIRLCAQKKYELLKDLLLEMKTLVSGKEVIPGKAFYELMEAPDPFSKSAPVLFKMMENKVVVEIAEPARFFTIASCWGMIAQHMPLLLSFAQQNMSAIDLNEFGRKLLMTSLDLTQSDVNLEVRRKLYPYAPKDLEALEKIVNGDLEWWVFNKPEDVRSVHRHLTIPLSALIEPFYTNTEMTAGAQRLLNSLLDGNKNLLFEMIEGAIPLSQHPLQFLLWKHFYSHFRNDFSIPIRNRAHSFQLIFNLPLKDKGKFCQMADAWIKEMITVYFSEDRKGFNRLAQTGLFEVVFNEIGALILARFRATLKKDNAAGFLENIEKLVLINKREPLIKLAFEDGWFSIAIGFIKLVTKQKVDLHMPAAFSLMLDALNQEDTEKLRIVAECILKYSKALSLKAKQIKLDDEGIRNCYSLCMKLQEVPFAVSNEQCVMVARNFTALSPFSDEVLPPLIDHRKRMILNVRQIVGIITYKEQMELYGTSLDAFIGAHQRAGIYSIIAVIFFNSFMLFRDAAYEFFNVTSTDLPVTYKH